MKLEALEKLSFLTVHLESHPLNLRPVEWLRFGQPRGRPANGGRPPCPRRPARSTEQDCTPSSVTQRRSPSSPFTDVDPLVRRRMAQIRKSATKPELLVRQAVRSLGIGYRLNRRELPGTPDLTFIGRRKVIFVHGCFWHQHGCHLTGKVPSTRCLSKAGARPKASDCHCDACSGAIGKRRAASSCPCDGAGQGARSDRVRVIRPAFGHGCREEDHRSRMDGLASRSGPRLPAG